MRRWAWGGPVREALARWCEAHPWWVLALVAVALGLHVALS